MGRDREGSRPRQCPAGVNLPRPASDPSGTGRRRPPLRRRWLRGRVRELGRFVGLSSPWRLGRGGRALAALGGLRRFGGRRFVIQWDDVEVLRFVVDVDSRTPPPAPSPHPRREGRRARRCRRAWAPVAGGRGRGAGVGDRSTRRVTPPIDQDVAGLQGCCPRTRLPLTKVPLELPRSLTMQLALVLEELAVTTADLRGADPDQAIVVATDTVDSIHQLERGRLASSADDLEYVIHLVAIPAGWRV